MTFVEDLATSIVSKVLSFRAILAVVHSVKQLIRQKVLQLLKVHRKGAFAKYVGVKCCVEIR